jgi:hypothetical protein
MHFLFANGDYILDIVIKKSHRMKDSYVSQLFSFNIYLSFPFGSKDFQLKSIIPVKGETNQFVSRNKLSLKGLRKQLMIFGNQTLRRNFGIGIETVYLVSLKNNTQDSCEIIPGIL